MISNYDKRQQTFLELSKNSNYKKNLESDWILTPESYNSLTVDRFDKTWGEGLDLFNKHHPHLLDSPYNYRFVNNKHTFDQIPPEQVLKGREDSKVEYRYNSELFRSDEFIKDHNGLHILFAGCSNTEGVGSNIEDTWSYLVYQEFTKQNKVSGYFNLGKGGYGWHKIISNCVTYINKYGAPDYLFINMPNILRNYIWNENELQYSYRQKLPYGDVGMEHNDYFNENKSTVEEHRKNYPIFLTSWILFVEYCKSLNIKLLWTTWDELDGLNIKVSGYFDDSFFLLKQNLSKDIFEITNGAAKESDIRARDGHPGRAIQAIWANIFVKEIQDRGWL